MSRAIFWINDERVMQSTVESDSARVRCLLWATALAVVIIFVLPIILFKTLRSAPAQVPLTVTNSSVPPVKFKQRSEMLPKPQAPSRELMQYP
jgi:hypothetical protein